MRGGLLAVGRDGLPLLGRGEAVDERVLGGEHHVGRAEERVGPGRVDADHVVGRRFGEAVGLAGERQLSNSDA